MPLTAAPKETQNKIPNLRVKMVFYLIFLAVILIAIWYAYRGGF